jgi:heat-inducible transcriptional repressor
MTPRQRQLLAAIIQEFISTATAVGSISLYDKYKFKVSPATIRNEMAALVREGYLDKPHSSAGRVPTTMGLRFFIEERLQEPEELDVVAKERVKTRLYQLRFDKEMLIREALKILTEISHNATVALIGKEIYYAGLADMLDIPEFQEISSLRRIMSLLENYAALSDIFNRSLSDRDVKVLIGEETGIDSFSKYAIVFSELRLHRGNMGYIAVIGPNRMNYYRIIPAVKYIAETISEVVKGW